MQLHTARPNTMHYRQTERERERERETDRQTDLCFSKTQRCCEIFPFLSHDVVVLAESFFQLEQLRRRERCADALGLAERQQEPGSSSSGSG